MIAELLLLLTVLGVSLASLFCLVYVLVKMYAEKGLGHALLGFFCCQLYPFIWGWMHATRLGIKDIMLFWTAISLFALVLQVVLQMMGITSAESFAQF